MTQEKQDYQVSDRTAELVSLAKELNQLISRVGKAVDQLCDSVSEQDQEFETLTETSHPMQEYLAHLIAVSIADNLGTNLNATEI